MVPKYLQEFLALWLVFQKQARQLTPYLHSQCKLLGIIKMNKNPLSVSFCCPNKNTEIKERKDSGL